MYTWDKTPLDWANKCVDSAPTMQPTRNQIACTVRDALQSQHEHFVSLVVGASGVSRDGDERVKAILALLGKSPKS